MISPYEAFRASDGWVVIGAGNDKLFQKLSFLLGHPEWNSDQKFVSNAKRVENRQELRELIEKITITKSGKFWEKELKKVDIPVAPVLALDEVSKEPQLRATGIVQKKSHPAIKNFKSIGLPLRINGKRPPLSKAPPT